MNPISYHLSIASISEHLLNIEMIIPANQEKSLTLSLPSWIPGSYMVRDFARNLHSLSALTPDGNPLTVEQVDKQTWRVENPKQAVHVSYTVFAFDLSVRSAYLADEYAFFNGTSTFLELKELKDVPCTISMTQGQSPTSWRIACSFKKQGGADAPVAFSDEPTQHFSASNYQELIDHPVLIGDFLHHRFVHRDTAFHMVLSGQPDTNIAKICEDLVPICEHHIELFGEMPCHEYWFLTLLSDDGFGGLEHRASTALLFPRLHLPLPNEFDDHTISLQSNETTSASAQRSEHYQQFLSLCSHELLHTWHVKRTRPEVMISPDLSAEVYTPQLWIYEGFTSLYDDLSLARTGLVSPQRYADVLSEVLSRLLRTPGRHQQTVAESSFDAWTKFYKQDASSVNHIVSYYNKGAVIALCLDITLRQLSDNKYSLDSLIKKLWQQYGKPEIGTPNDVIAKLCKQEFDLDISSFLEIAVHTTMDLPLATLLPYIGLSVNTRARSGVNDKGGKSSADSKDSIEFGAITKTAEVGVQVLSVLSKSAACEAGIQIGDRIIALDDWQVKQDNIQRLLNSKPLNSHSSISLLRQGRLLRLSMPIRAALHDTVALEIADHEVFNKWLMRM